MSEFKIRIGKRLPKDMFKLNGANETVVRATARASARLMRENWQLVSVQSIQTATAYTIERGDERRIILAYSITAEENKPYVLGLSRDLTKLEWQTNFRYVNIGTRAKPNWDVQSDGHIQRLPKQFADGKTYTTYSVLVQNRIEGHWGAPRLSRNNWAKNFWDRHFDQQKLNVPDSAYIHPLAFMPKDVLMVLMLRQPVGIKTAERDTVRATMVAFYGDEARIIEGKPYQKPA